MTGRRGAALAAALMSVAVAWPAAGRLDAQGARGSPRADTLPTIGSYVSSRIDDKRPPVRDLATDDIGTQYLIEFVELVLTLRANGEFRASLRYRQTLAPKGVPTTQEPIQRMTVHGTWRRDPDGTLRFVPDPRRGGEGLRILAGTHTARTISVPFDYRNGRVTRRSRVQLVFDPAMVG